MPTDTVADVLSPDGNAIVNQIVIAASADPARFGAVRRVAPASAIGWTQVAGIWGAPAPTSAPPSKAELVAHANQKQWALATGGFAVAVQGAAHVFATDVTSLALMNGKVARLAQPNPPVSFNWQIGGAWLDIAAADFPPVAVACADFVQATFDALKTLEAAIAAGTVTRFDQIDDPAAWPANS